MWNIVIEMEVYITRNIGCSSLYFPLCPNTLTTWKTFDGFFIASVKNTTVCGHPITKVSTVLFALEVLGKVKVVFYCVQQISRNLQRKFWQLCVYTEIDSLINIWYIYYYNLYVKGLNFNYTYFWATLLLYI